MDALNITTGRNTPQLWYTEQFQLHDSWKPGKGFIAVFIDAFELWIDVESCLENLKRAQADRFIALSVDRFEKLSCLIKVGGKRKKGPRL